jgi:hypothetical protein
VLRAHGQGVCTQREVPMTPRTEPTIAVALMEEGAFLHRESVLDLLGLGQFNPPRVRMGTRRHVRRRLPEWMALENRTDGPDEDLTGYEALRRDLIGEQGSPVHTAVSRIAGGRQASVWSGLLVLGKGYCVRDRDTSRARAQ